MHAVSHQVGLRTYPASLFGRKHEGSHKDAPTTLAGGAVQQIGSTMVSER